MESQQVEWLCFVVFPHIQIFQKTTIFVYMVFFISFYFLKEIVSQFYLGFYLFLKYFSSKMALAFYVPDQARLLNRTRKLQKIQNLRRFYWHYMIALLYVNIRHNVSTVDFPEYAFYSHQRLMTFLKDFVLNFE